MEELYSNVKLSLFEIISFVLPGIALVVLSSTLFPQYISLADISNNPIPYFILSFVLGLLLHSLSVSELLNWKQLGWKIYHYSKEKDAGGHGVKNPKTRRGKLARALRYRILESKLSKNSLETITSDILRERLNDKDLDNFDCYFIKESLFVQNSSLSKHYEHLHYQKLFARSLATVFLLYALLVTIIAIFGDYIFYLGENAINVKCLEAGVIVLSLCLYLLFLKRADFYKTYRDKIMSANILISGNKT